uniref:Putative metalloprotease n=1 Tax=Ixodes ricinus TaxID=34613 RepID=A0A0K8R3T1_IXORI
MDGTKLEANMYHDRIRMASVNVEVKNGIVEVKGILSSTLRITPLRIRARSEDGLIPHKISQIDHRADGSNTFKGITSILTCLYSTLSVWRRKSLEKPVVKSNISDAFSKKSAFKQNRAAPRTSF